MHRCHKDWAENAFTTSCLGADPYLPAAEWCVALCAHVAKVLPCTAGDVRMTWQAQLQAPSGARQVSCAQRGCEPMFSLIEANTCLN